MGLQVTSVSRREERLFDAAGAVFVLTREDLRRSGARTLPEALRLVPGVHVAQINGSQWAVSTRGFAGRFANKLLVLVDGRSVYTHLFSGVFWEELDIPLSEIERIEIVRGPGGALWGVNAVNGVINILTRAPERERGGSLDLAVESGERRLAVAAEGGGAGGAWRAWGATTQTEGLARRGGGTAHDSWRSSRGGFRFDRPLGTGELAVDLGVRHRKADQTTHLPSLSPPFGSAVDASSELAGGYSLLRWTRTRPSGAVERLQAYYESADRDELLSSLRVRTLDLDYQSFLPLGRNQELVWGGDVRRHADRLDGLSGQLAADPAERDLTVWSVFLQDQITLAAGRSHLTLGARAEHDGLSGWSWMPSARWQMQLPGDQTLWASAARSVRTPGRLEAELEELWLATVPSPVGLPVRLVGQGAADLGTEEMVSWELGYRVQPGARVSLDLAVFDNDYEHVLGACGKEPVFVAGPIPHLLQVVQVCNAGTAQATGVETAVSWTPSARWRWSLGYSYLDFSTRLSGSFTSWEEASARHLGQLRLQGNPAAGWEADLGLSWAEPLVREGAPAWLRVDLRLQRELRPGLGLEIVGRNLLEERHQEVASTQIAGVVSEVRRSAGLAIHWRF